AEFAHADLSAGLDQEDTGNKLQTVGRRDSIWILVDQQIERDSVLLGKTARFLGVIFGDSPKAPTRSRSYSFEDLLDVWEGKLGRRTAGFIENEGDGPPRQGIIKAVRPAVQVVQFEIRRCVPNRK